MKMNRITSSEGINYYVNNFSLEKKNVLIICASVVDLSFIYNFFIKNNDVCNILIYDLTRLFYSNDYRKYKTMTMIVNDIGNIIKKCMEGEKMSVIGIGFGAYICNLFVNENNKMIENYFCINGIMFVNRFFKIYNDMTDIRDDKILRRDVPYFTNLYTQYFIMNEISINDNVIERNKITYNIYIFHTKHNKIYSIYEQVRYAIEKKIPLQYFVYEVNDNYENYDNSEDIEDERNNDFIKSFMITQEFNNFINGKIGSLLRL